MKNDINIPIPDDTEEEIELSDLTKALLDSLAIKKRKETPLEGDHFNVSETVSFFGFVYEKVRNSIEFHEEHLIRRVAITRILKRRLTVNPDGAGEGENLARELLWGRYLPEFLITKEDIKKFQTIIEAYIFFFNKIKETHNVKNPQSLGNSILESLSCEIEENIDVENTHKRAAYLYYFYQTLRRKIEIEDLSKEDRDTYFYVAAERALAKNDNTFILYHLFTLCYGETYTYSPDDLQEIASRYRQYTMESQSAIKNPYNNKLTRFAQKQVPPFKILYSILDENKQKREEILTNYSRLKEEVGRVCGEKYKQTGEKLRAAAIKSIIYIFITKMLFVLILEIPLSKIIYGEVEAIPIIINTLFPPLLMAIIVTFISPPSDRNTQRILSRIVDILNRDPSFETSVNQIKRDTTAKKPLLLAAFSVLYFLLFALVFSFIYYVLEMLGFNFISKSIFIFFVCVVAFFGYRIRQTSKEYVLETKSNIFLSSISILFLPILYVGKVLSSQISKINIFIIFFDYFIETPFKFFIEIGEEWTRFLRGKKEELV